MPIRSRIMLFWLCAVCLPAPAWGQCSFQLNQQIPDNDTMEIPFLVSGLTNDALDDPAQGICLVSLSFDHEYLGDLVIELISPGGQSVELVGPVTTSINPTNLSMWNISFVPCSETPLPDAGFTAGFSNEQAWQILSAYAGSYHPHDGCLENFDTGPANGTWRLRIIDAGLNSIGMIDSFSVRFCDERGLECAACEANAGVFPNPGLSICAGEVLDSASFVPLYAPGAEPDPALYLYYYLLSRDNQLIDVGPLSSFTFQDAGTYELCGLSVAISDTAFLSDLVDSVSLTTLVSIVETVDPRLCADLTDLCMTINVETEPAPTIRAESICRGDTVRINGELFFEDGTYIVRIPRPSGCDSIIQLELQVNQIEAFIDPPARINCDTADLELVGGVSNATGPAVFSWFSPQGVILSDPFNDTVRVGRRERYFLRVSDGNCADTAFVDVVGDASYPIVIGRDAVIDCNQPVAEVQAQSLPVDVAYIWRGPSGQAIGNTPGIQVNTPGKYVVEVTDEDGCASVDTVLVGVDTLHPDAGIQFIRKNCAGGNTVFRGNPTGGTWTYNWQGPNMFESSDRTITVMDPGFYVLTVTGQNGCSGVDSIFNDADYQLPMLDIDIPDSLGCGSSGVQLSGSATPSGGTFEWAGPQGFASDEMDPVVFTAGIYRMAYTAPNDCFDTETIEVFQSEEVFPFSVITDTISCSRDSAVIEIQGSNLSVEWEGVPDSLAFSPSLKVSDARTYAALVVDTTTGCEQIIEIAVIADLRPPTFSLVRDTINCADPLARFTIIATGATDVDGVVWTFPDQSIFADSILLTDTMGIHRVTVRDRNGCERTTSFSPQVDTTASAVFVAAPDLGCVDSIQLSSISLDTTLRYNWSGPGNFNSNAASPFVADTGRYILEAVSLNGCITMDSAFVNADQDPPSFSISGGALTCANPVTELVPAFQDSVISFYWFQGNDTLSFDSTLMVNRPGVYSLSMTGLNQCRRVDSIFIDGPTFPVILVETDTITCDQPTVDLVAMNASGPADYAWIDTDQVILSNDSVLQVTTGDSIRLVVTGVNGCPADTIIVPGMDTLSPVAEILQLDEILCQERVVRLDGSTSSAMDPQYQWQALSGEIIGDPSDSLIMADDTGTYQLIVSEPGNGCRDTAFIRVEESPLSIYDLFLSVTPPSCQGDSDGMITVDSVQGGSGGFAYLFDGVMQTSPAYTGLPAGGFHIAVEDTSGCYFDTLVTLVDPEPFSFTISGDQLINIGETATLRLNLDFDSARLSSIQWMPDNGVSPCPNCLTYFAVPLESTTYEVFAEDSAGCSSSAEIFVQVIEKGKLFVPNVFTPNDDGQNDIHRFFAGPGIVHFDFFGIYDRWGDQVYGAEDFTLQELPQIGWDGTLEGEKMMSAVFTYLIKYRLVNGKTEVHKGDILLLR